MSEHFVFMSYRAEIPWIARLARALAERGIGTELWVVDPRERELAEATGAFPTIVDLRDGYTRPARNGNAPDDADVVRAARKLEDELGFGRFLHREASADRILTGRNHIDLPPMRMSHRWSWPDVCRLSLSIAESVRRRLRADPPRAVVAEASMFSARLVGRVALAEGVRFLSPITLPYLDARLEFVGFEGQWDRCVQVYDALEGQPLPSPADEVARTTLETLRRGSTMPVKRESVADYLNTPQARLTPRRVINLGTDWLAARAPEAVASPHNSYPELLAPTARLVRKARRRLVREAFDRETGDELPGSPYAAYFIHAQPEMTVDCWAFEHYDQVHTIRNIAAALPADVVLVVKEHRVQAGWRDPSFYKELHAIPGVVVLSDAVASSEVVRGAEMVFTLTGTVSLEAMCVGVPVVLLGNVYFEHFEGIERARDMRHLEQLFDERGAFATASDEDCLRALAARYLASYEGGWESGGRSHADERVTAEALLAETQTGA